MLEKAGCFAIFATRNPYTPDMIRKIMKWTAACALALMLNACKTAREISVLQFNIWQEGTYVPGGFEAVADEIARLNPDFVTLSEVRNYHNTRFCDRITEALKQRECTYYSFYSNDTGLLSRHPISDSTIVFPLQNDHGTIHKLRTRIGNRDVAVYTGHLDYLNDTYYEVRGYDGNTWKKMEAPLTDVSTILKRNVISRRDDAIRDFIAEVKREQEANTPIFFGGDFNEPSHLDWTEATKDSADHQGITVPWTCTVMLEQAGFKDAYRQLYPNPVTHPGYTYPSDNKLMPVSRLAWAPEADERERIDYIFYYPRKGLKVKEANIVGPRGCIVRNRREEQHGQDIYLTPLDVWPSDHKGVLVKFRVK